MDIKQTTRSVTDYHFSLSADELRAALTDPIAWADGVRAELSFELDVAAAPAQPRHGKTGKAKRVTAPKGSGRKPSVEAAFKCGVCGKPFKHRGWRAKHMEQAHPSAKPESQPAPNGTTEAVSSPA